jgi:hypothetical protein
MAPVPAGFEPIARHELVATALALGIERPDSLSTEELTEAIRLAGEAGPPEPPPGWFAVARHLVESVVEQGLNLPNAAKMLRAVGGRMWASGNRQKPPLPTVTLAQIYLSQGYPDRARATLTQVLARQPENHKAQRLLAELDATSAPASSDVAAEAAVALRSVPEDVVVVVCAADGVRVFWELAGKGGDLAPDQGVELLVRVFEPSPTGLEVREQRHAISTSSGAKGVRVSGRSQVRAALLDLQAGAAILGVAPIFRADGAGALQAEAPGGQGPGVARARSLALRMLATG